MARSSLNDAPIPSWLIDLEGRLEANNQNHQLQHEVGAGSRCLKCLDACPGLELHYWRKQCRVCKCKKEDHDVPTDTGILRFDILMRNAGSIQYKSFKGVLKMNINNSNVKYIKPKQFSEDSVNNPPFSIANKKMSSANDRTLPLNFVCESFAPKSVKDDSLTTISQVEFDWIPPDTSNELAVEYMSHFPVERLPISGTWGAKFRHAQLEKQIPLYDINPIICLRLTPKEQIAYRTYLEEARNRVGLGKIQKIGQKTFLENSVPLHTLKTPDHATMLKKKISGEEDSLKQKFDSMGILDEDNSVGKNVEKLTNIKNLNNNSPQQAHANLEQTKTSYSNENQILSENPNTPHAPTKTNKTPEMKSLNIDLGATQSCSPHPQPKVGFYNHPQGKTLKDPPQPCVSDRENIVADAATAAEQLNLDVNNCNCKEELTKEKCRKCEQPLIIGSVAVQVGGDNLWHPQCFVCDECQELLVDLVYFYYKGKIFCGRHYAEKRGIYRCGACDELIFTDKYTYTDGLTYHVNHFCCEECDQPLADKEYVLSLGRPYCLNCYNVKFGKVCAGCGQVVDVREQSVTVKELSWHANEKCFKCNGCKQFLIKSEFMIKSNKLYCKQKTCLPPLNKE